jgi:CheY-like chemotaxis protein
MRSLLLADDEIYVTSVISLKLAAEFDDILCARDGLEALELALQHPPTLLISDFQMPVCDGLELATRLRADPRTAAVPVILLTARGHLLSPEQLAKTNIRAMLPKPFSIRDLQAAVLSVLSQSDTSGVAA